MVFAASLRLRRRPRNPLTGGNGDVMRTVFFCAVSKRARLRGFLEPRRGRGPFRMPDETSGV
ncbi:MAG: hypothetical protein EDS66_04215 [Planctomycetota bacterium]|nr:MAG: hypothetical protein EDS66_04215 [Planctomycetota bacterium]MCQ3920647.1 hypothetical protein [Planctomycetota bacterium]